VSTYEVRHERRPASSLRHYEPNPRRLRDPGAFVALCLSYAEFGQAQSLCALDDGRVLGGNQGLDALAQLKRGFDVPRRDGKPGTERLQWEPRDGLVDVMVVHGASAEQAKALNLALNRHAGEDVEDEVAKVLRELQQDAPHLLGAIDTDEEIARLLEVDEDPPAGHPPDAKGVPSITLQFTSAGAHTRVKQALAKAQEKRAGEERVPSGDLLDEVLRASRKAPVPASNGAKKKPTARARA
jgi:hypothetical protein